MGILVHKLGDITETLWRANTSLTGTTIELVVKDGAGTPVEIDPADVEIFDFNGGIVAWQLDGTLEVGLYSVELEITRGTDFRTAPTIGVSYLKIE